MLLHRETDWETAAITVVNTVHFIVDYISLIIDNILFV